MSLVSVIARKRDGYELTREEIESFIAGVVSGEVKDYQASAWLMAAFIRGLSRRETADLTRSMIETGRRLDLSSVAPFVADKHSTGGVGDKTTLVVGPLVAALGVPVGKMSGRGLGFSGGTIDKLESIPGFRTALSPDEFVDTLRRTGLVVAAQTTDLAPADGKLYALRDVTATIDSIPLIASSIMSKKIAAGASGVVLDVKAGRGAFVKSVEEARALAATMRDIGREVGLGVRAVISGMDQPLGFSVGNALEVAEAVETLQGRGPADLVEVAVTLGSHLLHMAGRVESTADGAALLRTAVEDGRGLAKFREFVRGQGGDDAFVDDLWLLPQAPVRSEVTSESSGYVASIGAERIGEASVLVGAGRAHKGASIDHSVGFTLHVKVGDRVEEGQKLATIHAASREAAREVEPLVRGAFRFSPQRVAFPPTVLEVIA